MSENSLLTKTHILICLNDLPSEFDYLKKNFCGIVMTVIDKNRLISFEANIYLYGNIYQIYNSIKNFGLKTIYVIKELSDNYDELCENYKIIDIGKVPINIHNVGVYFRNFFDSKDYFNVIKNEHEFKMLTESNKPNNALRKGIYLANVEETTDGLIYNLLRCSSNLDGPTDNLRSTDNFIIAQVNNISQHFFREKVELNHVLAQIYENNNKGKAKIKSHSDKTKDMPRNGIIAFCTFYDNMLNKRSKTDIFDYVYNKTSALTKLHFKLKHSVDDKNLIKEFNITLYPNSVFLIPLSTNRLYTHEIRPSILPFDKIPTRMGYVIRCSKTRAIFKNNQTYIIENDAHIKLEEFNEDNIAELRNLYYEENSTDKLINYGNIYFSMNSGDYIKPIL